MDTEKNIEQIFIEYLIKNGYPEQCIVPNWGNKASHIDLAIIDIETKLPIAFYEIKKCLKNETIMYASILRLKKFMSYLDYKVTVGIIFEGLIESHFDIYDVTEIALKINGKNWKKLLEKASEKSKRENLIKYDVLSSTGKAKIRKAMNVKIGKNLNGLRNICWFVLPPITLLLLVLDKLGFYILTYERLIVIGALCLSLILPFFGEIKFGDLILKNATKEKDNDGK